MVIMPNKPRQADQISASSSLQFSRCAGRYAQGADMPDISKIIEFIKLSVKQAIILFIGSSVLLFASDDLIQKLGILEFRDLAKTWIGAAWILSASILLCEIVFAPYSWAKQKIQQSINLKKYQQRLHQLTPNEKDFLSGYIFQNTKTQSAEYSNGTVNGLISSKVIFRSSNMAIEYNIFPYNIQPWAWEYLKANPHYLE